MVPRLERFLSKYPGIDVRILASRQIVDASDHNHDGTAHAASAESPDIEIQFSNGPPAGEFVDPLFSVYVVPMCHPRLIAASPPMVTPDDLRHRTLLHADSRLSDREQSGWAKWLKHAGATQVDPRRGLQLEHSTLALEAAADGLGVTLAMPMLASQELAEGKVQILFPIELPVAKSYFVVTSRSAIHRPEVSAFRSWLLEEAKKDRDLSASTGINAAVSLSVRSQLDTQPSDSKKKPAPSKPAAAGKKKVTPQQPE
jgi:LysR family glycine cleavage system transcriptional activator